MIKLMIMFTALSLRIITDVLVRTCVKKAGIPLESAVKMITEVPARIMKLQTKGKLEIGYDADIVIFDDDVKIKKLLVAKEEIL